MVKHRERLDRTFSALSDQTRRAIVTRLSRGECSVGELARPLDMSLPAVSKHLRVLERAGLIVRRREGRIHRCRLAPAPMDEATTWMDRQRMRWDARLSALASYLEGGER